MKKILGIILIIIGLPMYLFFSEYRGELLPYPTLWFIAGILLSIGGLALLLKKSSKEINQEKKLEKDIAKLKKNGTKVQIGFKDFEIHSNKYYKEIPRSNSYRVQGLDGAFNNEKAVKNIELNQSRISYKHPKYGIEFISPLINMDEVTLSFLMEKQKNISIYFDKNNIDNFYFDLDFIQN